MLMNEYMALVSMNIISFHFYQIIDSTILAKFVVFSHVATQAIVFKKIKRREHSSSGGQSTFRNVHLFLIFKICTQSTHEFLV